MSQGNVHININTGGTGYSNRPVAQLKTNRGLIKTILLTLITFGIYPIVFYSGISNDINLIAGRYDGRKTMHYCLLFFIVSPITLGIGSLVWMYKVSDRIGNEASRRRLGVSLSGMSYLGWGILGAFILVGPFVYLYKLCSAMNALAADYNVNG